MVETVEEVRSLRLIPSGARPAWRALGFHPLNFIHQDKLKVVTVRIRVFGIGNADNGHVLPDEVDLRAYNVQHLAVREMDAERLKGLLSQQVLQFLGSFHGSRLHGIIVSTLLSLPPSSPTSGSPFVRTE